MHKTAKQCLNCHFPIVGCLSYFTHSVFVYILAHIITFTYNIGVLVLVFKTSSWIWATVKAVLSILFVLLITSGVIIVFIMSV